MFLSLIFLSLSPASIPGNSREFLAILASLFSKMPLISPILDCYSSLPGNHCHEVSDEGVDLVARQRSTFGFGEGWYEGAGFAGGNPVGPIFGGGWMFQGAQIGHHRG